MSNRIDITGLDSLNNAVTDLYASKSNDRKKKLEALRELLFEDDLVASVVDSHSLGCRSSFNSKEDSSRRTWDSIFDAVRFCYDQKYNQKGITTHQMAFTMLQSIVKRANRHGPYLSCNRAYDLVLSQLTNPELSDVCSYGFMQLLQNLLSTPAYTAAFQGGHWKNIILTLIDLFKNSTIPKTMILETLNVSIIHGSNIPEVVLVLRKEVVQFYRYVYVEEQNRAFLPTPLINRGIVLLCRYNAIEFRGILCQLGEQIIPVIIPTVTNAPRDHDEEGSVIDVLLVQMQLHAPLDLGKSAAFYASNETTWDTILDRIYLFVVDLVEEIAKKSGYTKNVTIPSNLLSLAVKTTRMVHERRPSEDGDIYPPPKRHMVQRSFHAIVYETVQHQPCEAAQLVWVQYISAVFNGYPEIADASVLASLHRLGISLLNSSFIASPEVYVFLRSILTVEKHLGRKGITGTPKSWTHVWDIVIKSLEVNGAKPEPMEFIRSLLIQVDSNLNSLLFLFAENGLEPGPESLNLLSEFLSRCSLPEFVKVSPCIRSQEATQDKSCPRLGLIKWIVNSLLEKCVENSERDLARVLVSLLVQRSSLFMQIETEFEDSYQITVPFRAAVEDFEPCLVRSSFVALPVVKRREVRVRMESEEHGGFRLMEGISEKLLISLQKDLEHRCPPIQADADFSKKLPLLQYRLGVLVYLLDYLYRYELGEDDLRSSLAELLEVAFRRYTSIVLKFLNQDVPVTTFQMYSVLEVMLGLVQNQKLVPEVKELLASKYTDRIVDFWKRCFWNGLPNRYVSLAGTEQRSPTKEFVTMLRRKSSAGIDIDDNQKESDVAVSDKRAIEMASAAGLQCLLGYAGINAEAKTGILTELFKDCEEIAADFNPKIQFHFTLCLDVLEHMSSSFSELRACHNDIMTLLQSICRSFHSDMNCAVKIWEIFGRLAPAVGIHGDETVRKQFMSLVGNLTKRLARVGVDVAKASFNTLSIMAKCDPLSLWTLTKPGAGIEEKSIFPLVVEMLKSNNHQLRLGAVALFWNVFEAESSVVTTHVSEAIVIQASHRRGDLFELIYTNLMELFTIPAYSDEENVEEAINRTAIAISTLSKTIFIYPFNQKRVLFGLFLILRLKSINVFLAQRALKNENPAATKTLTAHIHYALEKWIRHKYSILEFPFQLFDCSSSDEFFVKYRREISFQLFQYSEVDNSRLLEDFSRTTFIPVLDLIKDCYGMIMSRLILGLASLDESDKSGRSSLNTITVSYNRLIQIFGNVVKAEDYMKECLDDVILNLINLTFDPQVLRGWECSVRIPEPEQPFYDETKIYAGFDHLRHKLGLPQKQSVIGYMVQTCPQKLYRILLQLVLRIHNAHDALEQFWRLHHYSFFVKLTLAESRDIFEGMRPYACQFIVHSYLRLLKDQSNSADFVSALLRVLSDYTRKLTSLSTTEMGLHFHAVVSQVITVATKWPETSSVVTKLLDFLLKTNSVTFTKEISSLDPFPSDIEIFTEYRDLQTEIKYGRQRKDWSLDRELSACLENKQAYGDHCTKERLRFIKQLLAQRKFDMEGLVNEMRKKRFSDECERNRDTIHGLIQMLLGVITSSTEEEVILEAGRCLGEIGPIDLSVLVLPSYNTEVKLSSAEKTPEAILASAAENLLSDDIDLVATTGEVLDAVMKTTEVQEVVQGTSTSALPNTNPRLCQILIPFSPEGSQSVSGKTVGCNPSTLETQLQMVEVDDHVTYDKWVTQLTCGLIMALRPETTFLHRLLPLCRLKVSFCEDFLPYVVYECLMTFKTNPIVRTKLSSYFSKFFSTFSTLNQGSNEQSGRNDQATQNLGVIYTNKLALRSLLKVVQFLRNHEVPFERQDKRTPWDNNFWMDLDYLELAKAAQYCGAFLSSILYSEIYAYSTVDKERLVQGFPSHDVPRSKLREAEIEKLLLKAYINIGESDAVYGCGSARYSHFTSNVQHLAQMNQWNRALAAYEATQTNFQGCAGVATSLKELGLFSTLWTYLQGSEGLTGKTVPELTEIQYECAWRLSKWDLNCDKANYVREYNRIEESVQNVPTVQKSIYESIQTALSNDKLRHSESIRRGLLSIVRELKHASLESAENLYPFLTQFQMFRIVEDFYTVHSTGVPIDSLLVNWQVLDNLASSNLKFQEPVLSLRSILLKAFHDQQPSPTLDTSYDDCVLNLLWKAREAGRLELAETCANNLRTRSMQARKQVEIAKNHWARGEQDVGISILGKFIRTTGTGAGDQNPDIQATSLLLYGDWLSETQSENPNTIMDHFTKCVKLYENKQAYATVADVSTAYVTLARYADSLYQNVSVYSKSEIFQAQMRTLVKAKAELEQMQKTVDPRDNEGQKSIALLKRQVNLDGQETASMTADSKRYLTIALRYYLRGLKHSPHHDLLIFRVIGLWLDNPDVKETLEIFTQEALPSYKYVIVLHQLSARLGLSGNNGVAEALKKVLLDCARDHPYHTLPVLLAQALMDKDREYTKAPVKKNARVDAARHLVETLKSSPMRDLVSRMESLWTALISLANTQEESKNVLPKAIPEDAPLRKLKNMGTVPIPTITIPVSPIADYKNSTVGIHVFDVKYVLVGGINSPKKILCRGTNGKNYTMLLKGQDDLRQDAVMQQVFAVMNKMLLAEPKTKARQLQVRTYKVCPLSQRSGVIEWCEETQTLGGYLIRNHPIYRPGDYTPMECRKKMNEAAAKPKHVKMEVYTDVTTKFKPIFRHFFFERFKDAGTFFERRLAYTRSVATSSIVGYLLGLGDRHVLNILVDLKTAEFIHIDLGVAFEQGRLLPTPETVPFRLTRDVVDGMGFCGVEGDFRRCCEMTLDVLRNNTEIILTILEVLLYDPLYMWTLSDDRIRKVQPGGRNNANATLASTQGSDGRLDQQLIKERNTSASRVLLRLRQKLLGVDEGISGSTLGTTGHVSFLIQKACDPTRLSRLFPGWQPYL